MPSREAKLLSDFLLSPASLQDCITLRHFTNLFPPAHRANPAIKELYQELQRIRQGDVNAVRENIVDEVKSSKPLRREYVRERRDVEGKNLAGLDRVALQMELDLFEHGPRGKSHTLQTIHPNIEEACISIEAQVASMESELQDALLDVKDVVSELSDLRYGHFPKSTSGEDIRDEVLATLKRLESTCAKSAG
ncbi:hypothetical protein P154DRAFT_425015 [Amniculicola lignicola CBS 123094]|uniref:Cnl2/NKP2 family protein-domain-containing protein n=1 Tax=Amniculicola lignicola CBS 123094 TaxID=1392246 RepID=A0A6A5WTA8_9PLEO|nr:hypothetical protein P154DRAFT_425015 [Amniculicola lignicola CBS 123094]